MKNKFIKPLQYSIYAGFIFVIITLSPQAKAISADFISKDGLRVLELVNSTRKQNSLNDLIWNEKLANAAQIKAEDMVKYNYFDHTSPSGVKAWNFINNEKYSYFTAGENLAIDFNTVETATDAWKKSPTHLANILNKDYTEFGFASLQNSNGSNLYVQIFARPKSQLENELSNFLTY